MRDWDDIERQGEAFKVKGADALAGSTRYSDYGADAPVIRGVVKASPYVWIDPTDIPPREWLLGRWLLRKALATMIAPGAAGKTTLLCGISLSMVTAQSLLGKHVWGGPKRVWIWNLEDPLQELQRSIQAACKHWGLGREDIEGRLFIDTAMEGSPLCTAEIGENGFRLIAPVYDAIVAELKARGIDLLVIDPFVSSHEIDENDNNKMDKIAKAWARVAYDANCAVVLCHHTSKAGAGEVTALSGRGAVALINAGRMSLVLNRMDSETADRFGFDDAERRRYFTVFDDKANRAPAEKADWFRLESVQLGNDGPILPGDDIGVATPWGLPDPFEGLTGSHLLRVQQAVDGGEWRDNWQSPQWVGHAVASVIGVNADAKADRRRIIQMVKTWIEKEALVVIRRKDERRKMVAFVEVGKWAGTETAPPKFSGAAQGGAVERADCSTTTPLPIAGVERSGAGRDNSVERREPVYPHGNRALKPIERDPFNDADYEDQ